MNEFSVSYVIPNTMTDNDAIDYIDTRSFRALLDPVIDFLKNHHGAIAIGPIKRVRQPWYCGCVESGMQVILSTTISAVREQPVTVLHTEWKHYTHQWTLWERLKFVFTNKLPYRV